MKNIYYIMKMRKENISARVPCALKKIVVDSDFSHRDAYELGAKIIASGDAPKAINQVDENPISQRTIKEAECKLVEERKHQLEEELRNL